MKNLTLFYAILLVAFSFKSCKSEAPVVPVNKTDISEFLGQWTIDIDGGSVGWIEVRKEDDYLDADILWQGGSVLPVSNIFLAKDQVLTIQRSNNVVRKRDENNNPIKDQIVTDWLEITKNGEQINGILLSPRRNGLGVDTTAFTGTKLPPPPPAPDLANLKFGTPVNLFNGKDLTGWRLINEKQKNGFSVSDGISVK